MQLGDQICAVFIAGVHERHPAALSVVLALCLIVILCCTRTLPKWVLDYWVWEGLLGALVMPVAFYFWWQQCLQRRRDRISYEAALYSEVAQV